jgi:hypothetical protein
MYKIEDASHINTTAMLRLPCGMFHIKAIVGVYDSYLIRQGCSEAKIPIDMLDLEKTLEILHDNDDKQEFVHYGDWSLRMSCLHSIYMQRNANTPAIHTGPITMYLGNEEYVIPGNNEAKYLMNEIDLYDDGFIRLNPFETVRCEDLYGITQNMVYMRFSKDNPHVQQRAYAPDVIAVLHASLKAKYANDFVWVHDDCYKISAITGIQLYTNPNDNTRMGNIMSSAPYPVVSRDYALKLMDAIEAKRASVTEGDKPMVPEVTVASLQEKIARYEQTIDAMRRLMAQRL